jgi:hypothetical protein
LPGPVAILRRGKSAKVIRGTRFNTKLSNNRTVRFLDHQHTVNLPEFLKNSSTENKTELGLHS